ncbi:MAG: hypothetical protein QXF35_03115 [Candidatus Bilamarchaeaceae archaeon]
MADGKKTISLRYKIISNILLVSLSTTTFFSQPNFKNPFRLNDVMAEGYRVSKQPQEIDINKKIEEITKINNEKKKNQNIEELINYINKNNKNLNNFLSTFKQTTLKAMDDPQEYQKFLIYVQIINKIELHKNENFISIVKEIIEKIKEEKKDIWEAYDKYLKDKGEKPKLTTLIKIINDIKTGEDSYPNYLKEAVLGGKKGTQEIPPSLIIPTPIKKIDKEDIESTLKFAEKRIEYAKETIQQLKEMANEIKNNEEKKKVDEIIAKWEEKIENYEKIIKESKEAFYKTSYEKEDATKIKNITKIATEIEEFIKNELVHSSDIRITKQFAYHLIGAMTTGTEGDYTEVQKLKAILENTKTIAPKKYEFCIMLIKSFVQEVSPDVYKALESINSERALNIAIAAVLTANDRELQKIKEQYGNDFVSYVLGNREKINEKEIREEAKKRINIDFETPITQSLALLDAVRILRNRLTYILTSTDSLESMQKNISNWMENYKKIAGNDLALLNLFYDIDKIAETAGLKKPTNTEEAKKLFLEIFNYLNQNQQQTNIASADAITKFYLLKVRELATKYNLDAKAVEAMDISIIALEKIDRKLIPAFYEDVVVVLAKTLEGRSAEFSESLLTFSGLLQARYPTERANLSFLVLDVEEKFKKVFIWFKENIPQATAKMTHYELMEETRERSELTEYEVYPPYNLYGLKESIWQRPSAVYFQDVFYRYGIDYLPNPQIPYPATMPYGPLTINTDAEGLHLKLDNQLNPFIPTFGRPTLSGDFRITAVSRAVMLATIRKAFGQISMYSPYELIAAYGESAGYYRWEEKKGGKITETMGAGGLRGKYEERHPAGGLAAQIVGEKSTTTREEGGGTEEIKTTIGKTDLYGTLTGGGVGSIVTVADNLRFTEEERPNSKNAAMKATINQLSALSQENGQSLLVYFPDIETEEKIVKDEKGVEKTESKKIMGGKVYYINPHGDVYQLALGHNEFDAFKQFLYGSMEKENVLASMRKYGQWGKTDIENLGGAIGFTIGPIATFAMEDAIRRIGATTTTKYDETVGRNVSVVDFTKLEAVGYSGVPLAMAFNTLENGTFAFITRFSTPVETVTKESTSKTGPAYEKGIYNLEMIIRNIQPQREYEVRVMGGWPGDFGVLYKIGKKEGEKETRWLAKASTSTYILYSDLFTYEREAQTVAEYVRTTMGELYNWSEDRKTMEGHFIGFTLMNAAISDTMEKYTKLSDMGWDNTYFTVVGSYYAKKFGMFGGLERTPGYGNQINQLTLLIEQRRQEMLQYPERAEEIAKSLDEEIKRMRNTKFWKPVVGMQWDPETFQVRLIGKAEIAEYKEKGIDLGYSLFGGNFFVGHKKGMQPYFELSANTLRYNQNAYLDLLFALGAAKVNWKPSSTFTFYTSEKDNLEGIMKWLKNNKKEYLTALFTKYYKLDQNLEKIENYKVEMAKHLKEEGGAKVYYILFDQAREIIFIGNEKDRESWIDKFLEEGKDFFVLHAEKEKDGTKITIETANVNESKIMPRMKLIGSVPLKMYEKETERVGGVGALLADVFTNYKQQWLMALVAGKRIFENEDWSQYSFVVSTKWNNVNLANIQDKMYGYVVINHITKEISVITPEEMKEEIKRTTGATGITWARFDGILGETAKLNFYLEAGVEEYTTSIQKIGEASKYYNEKLIGRLGLSYDWKQQLYGYPAWLTIGIVGYVGYWPLLGVPTNITDIRTLMQQPFYGAPNYDTRGVMFYIGGSF